MTLRLGRRVATPALHSTQPEPHEALELPLKSRRPLQPRAGLENVAPDQVSPKLLESKLSNKENLENLAENPNTKRKLFEKEGIEEIVEAVRRAPPGETLAALSGLRKALAKPRPALQAVFRCGGAELLVSLLRSGSLSAAGETEAAWSLVQLASGSSGHTKQLVQAGVCSMAMEKLRSSPISSELCELLLQMLANVAGDVDSKFRDALLEEDVVDLLGQLFGEMEHLPWSYLEREEVLRSFTWLMASLCRNTPLSMYEKVDCAFDFFAQVLLGTSDAEMLGSAMWGLCHLLEVSEEERGARARRLLRSGFDEAPPSPHPLLQQLLRCMRSQGDWRSPLPTAALHLATLLTQEHLDALLQVGLLPALHADLVDAHAPTEVRRGAARALASVAKQRPAALAEQPGLAEALCDSTEVQGDCALAILNLLEHGPEMFLRLGMQRVVSVLMNALQSEVSLQGRAMDCLQQMQHLKLCHSDVVSKLQRLCHSESGGVSEKANVLLQDFFPWAR